MNNISIVIDVKELMIWIIGMLGVFAGALFAIMRFFFVRIEKTVEKRLENLEAEIKTLKSDMENQKRIHEFYESSLPIVKKVMTTIGEIEMTGFPAFIAKFYKEK